MKTDRTIENLRAQIPESLTRPNSAPRERDPRDATLAFIAALGGNVDAMREPLLEHRMHNRKLGLCEYPAFVALEFLEIAERQASELTPHVEGSMHVAIHPELVNCAKPHRDAGYDPEVAAQLAELRPELGAAIQRVTDLRWEIRKLEYTRLDPNLVAGYLLLRNVDIDRRREAALTFYMNEVFFVARDVVAAIVGRLRRGTIAVDLDNPDVLKILTNFGRDATRHLQRIDDTQEPGYEWKWLRFARERCVALHPNTKR